MVDFWVYMIDHDLWTLDNVPSEWKSAVEAAMKKSVKSSK